MVLINVDECLKCSQWWNPFCFCLFKHVKCHQKLPDLGKWADAICNTAFYDVHFMDPQWVQGFFDNIEWFWKKLNSLFTFAQIIKVLPSHMTGICSDLFGFVRDLMQILRYLNLAVHIW